MAEFALADLGHVIRKPENLSHNDAAGIPLTALTAWQVLYDQAQLKKGQRIHITGAARPTGLFAIWTAKIIGAYFIGSASLERSFQLLNDFGIDEIVNYKETRLDDAVHDVDVVFDTIGSAALEQAMKTLKKDGVLVNINDPEVQKNAELAGVRGSFYIVSMDVEQLGQIMQLLGNGVLKTTVDSVYPLIEAREAFKYAAKGHAHDRVILKVVDVWTSQE